MSELPELRVTEGSYKMGYVVDASTFPMLTKKEAEEVIHRSNCHDALVAALEFYADEANSVKLVSGRRNILSDGGAIAKAALAKVTEDK